jgi:polyisoprenoid-binding protein YceI
MLSSDPEIHMSANVSRWNIDPTHSQVEFSVRHMMFTDVKGSFNGIEGAVHLDAENLAGSSVEVSIDAASVDTRNADRDNHLRSGDFFDVEVFPTLTFKSTAVAGSGDRFQVTGDLTIRGVTKSVTLDAEQLGTGKDPWGNQRAGFRGETKISRKEFGLTWNAALETGGVLVGDDIKIVLELQTVHAG